MSLADRLLLFPRHFARHAPEGFPWEQRHIAGPAGRVQVFIARHCQGADEPARAFALWFYGNGDLAPFPLPADLADLPAAPIEVWCMNYPGYGGSEGGPRLARIAPAALAVYDALQQEARQRPIFVFGRSLGATAALCVAARRPVAAVMLRTPPPLPELIRGRHGWWNGGALAALVARQIPPELSCMANARNCRMPALFTICGADAVVPPRYQQQVADAYAGPRQVIIAPGCGHNACFDTETRTAYRRVLAQWFSGTASL